MTRRTVLILLGGSLALNMALFGALALQALEGCAEMPSARVGTLSRSVSAGGFMEEEPLFTLPKGLVVREASASGAGWFEPYRFRLVITSDDPNLLNYSSEDVPTDRAEYYSAEVDRNRELQELYGDGAR